MTDSSSSLHQLRSALALMKMRLQIGGYPKEVLLRELDEAIALLGNVEKGVVAEDDPAVRLPESVPVVVVDDEPQLADVLARRLAREGLVTRAAHDLDSARSELIGSGGNLQEVVILDLSMLASATEEERKWVASVRPVVITGASFREVERLLDGIDAYAIVQKPFSSEQLALLVRRRAAEEGA